MKTKSDPLDLKRRKIDHLDAIAYSPEQFAHVSSLSLRKLWELWDKKEGPPYAKIDGRRVIPRRAAEAWLEKRMQQTVGECACSTLHGRGCTIGTVREVRNK